MVTRGFGFERGRLCSRSRNVVNKGVEGFPLCRRKAVRIEAYGANEEDIPKNKDT